MADTKISAATDAGTLLATDMLPLARAGSTSAYHATMTEIGAFTNATLPVASTTVPGVVKVDGSTITIASGVISGVSPAPYGSLPAMDGTANAGAVSAWSRGDHVHPIDTSRAPLASPPFTGTPTAPTPTTGDNSTKLATTAFVQAQMVASGAGVSTWNTRAGAVVLQQSDLVAQGDFHDTGRNLVMNGAFSVAQRGAGPWTTNGAYALDRWQLALSVDTASVIQGPLSDADRAAIGDEAAAYYMQNTFTGSATGGSFNTLSQKVEDTKRLGNKTVTLSYWAKAASGTPVVATNWQQNFGSGGSAQVQGAYVQQTISTVWTRYSRTFTLPSVAGKTIGAGDNTTIVFAFSIQGSFVQSGIIAFWGVQLEIGTQATPFDAGGTPADQLRQCQRFYQTGSWVLYGYNNASQGICYVLGLPVQMRASPTMTSATTSSTNLSGLTIGVADVHALQIYANATATGPASGYGTWTASADL